MADQAASTRPPICGYVYDTTPLRPREFEPGTVFTVWLRDARITDAAWAAMDPTSRREATVRVCCHDAWAAALAFVAPGDVVELHEAWALQPYVNANAAASSSTIDSAKGDDRTEWFVCPLEGTRAVVQSRLESGELMELVVDATCMLEPRTRVLREVAAISTPRRG
jgi:hypothetical protein